MYVTAQQAFAIVIALARLQAKNELEVEACNVIEDIAVNQYGDD